MSVIDRRVGLQYVVVIAAVCEPMEGRFNVCHRCGRSHNHAVGFEHEMDDTVYRTAQTFYTT